MATKEYILKLVIETGICDEGDIQPSDSQTTTIIKDYKTNTQLTEIEFICKPVNLDRTSNGK